MSENPKPPNPVDPILLQKATVPIITDAECRKVYGETKVTDSMLCGR